MGKKTIIFSLLVFSLLFLVASPVFALVDDVQTNVNTNTGLEIVYPKFFTVEFDTPFQLNIYVHNITDGTNLTSSNCTLQIQNHTGHIVLDSAIPFASSSYQLNLSETYFSDLDEYVFYIQCQDNGVGGLADGRFQVTADGNPINNFPTVYPLVILAIVFLTFNKYLSKVFETDLFNIFAGMLFLVAGVLTLYPGFNYINWTTLEGLGIGSILIGIGVVLIFNQVEESY